VVQYNYLHDNGMGYLSCACNTSTRFDTATVRYNVLANNKNTEILLDSVSGSVTNVYNNTIYNTAATKMVGGSGPTTFTNNVFYTTLAQASMVTSGVTYRNNLYGGNSPTIPSGDSHPVTGNPQFANPTGGGTGTQASGPDLKAGLNWRIAAGSPAVHAGVAIANNGGLDYNGVAIPTVPDIGALQHP
jgi:hypothetical protein